MLWRGLLWGALAAGLVGGFLWTRTEIRSRQPLTRKVVATTSQVIAAPSVSGGSAETVVNGESAGDDERVFAAREVIENGTEEEATAAIRLLGDLGGHAAINILEMIGADGAWAAEFRKEAIQSLRRINTASAARALKRLIQSAAGDEALLEEIYAALGSRPWDEVAAVFEPVLRDASVSSSLRVAVAEAMGYTTMEALPYLHQAVALDADANVRAAAAWAMSIMRVDQQYGKELARLLPKEPDTMVRRRMYEALLAQKDNAALEVTPLIEKETDVAARVAALNALGDAVSRSMDAQLAASFDDRWVKTLTDLALSADTENLQLRSVFALRRAGTPGSMQALDFIQKNARAQRVAVAAAHATSFNH